jgi:hypothetical protein
MVEDAGSPQDWLDAAGFAMSLEASISSLAFRLHVRLDKVGRGKFSRGSETGHETAKGSASGLGGTFAGFLLNEKACTSNTRSASPSKAKILEMLAAL